MSETPNHNHDRSGRFTANNRYKFRPSDAPPDSDPARDALRTALFRHGEEQQRCDALESAKEKCHEQLRAAWHSQTEAELKLNEVQQANPDSHSQDLAYSYLNDEAPVHNPALVIQQSAVAQAQRDVARLTETEAALDSEIQQSQRRLGYLRTTLTDRTRDAVCGSAQFHELLEELSNAWGRLRGIKKAFAIISKGVGTLPYEYHTKVHQSVSLDHEVIGLPLWEAPALAWEQALVRLRDDADSELPNITDITDMKGISP
jgi:hypothetical protein